MAENKKEFNLSVKRIGINESEYIYPEEDFKEFIRLFAGPKLNGENKK